MVHKPRPVEPVAQHRHEHGLRAGVEARPVGRRREEAPAPRDGGHARAGEQPGLNFFSAVCRISILLSVLGCSSGKLPSSRVRRDPAALAAQTLKFEKKS